MDNWKEYQELWEDFSEPTNIELCPLTGVEVGVRWGLERNVKCECGMNKVYGANNDIHSDWCPLYGVKNDNA